MFRLAHMTDPHFRGSYRGVRVRELLSKRVVGAVNLLVNRRRKHNMGVLDVMREDLAAQAVDHLVLTGDLSNVSLEGEWLAALRWIEATGRAPSDVTVVPGNHDAYVPDVVQRGSFERLFGAYQSADVSEPGERYPFARVRDGVAVIGVNTCVATGDFGAWGRIGAEQLARLELLLARPELAGRARVLLIHHPPIALKGGEERNLRDRVALGELLARVGAELILHGHDHLDQRAWLPGPGGRRIPAVGAGSASYGEAPPRAGSYNVYEIEGEKIVVVTRAYNVASKRFEETKRESLAQSPLD